MPDSANIVAYRDCGRIGYEEAWALQTRLFDEQNNLKLFNRQHPEHSKPIPNYLLFCEHNPVFTLGKSGNEENLLLSKSELNIKGIDYFKTNRGGDITYHGPGQITGYPLFDLEQFFTDIHKYMRFLEEIIIRTCAEYGISAGRIAGLTGVWVRHESPQNAQKICALGLHMSRWITMHGFGLNVNTDLNHFRLIIPCGIQDKGVTSLQKELGREIPLDEVKQILLHHFEIIFKIKVIPDFSPLTSE
jgi:lipoyl(octanoyl) transferase